MSSAGRHAFHQAALRRFSKAAIKYYAEKYASFPKFEISFIFLTDKSVILHKSMKRVRCWEICICSLLEVSQLERCSAFQVTDILALKLAVVLNF